MGLTHCRTIGDSVDPQMLTTFFQDAFHFFHFIHSSAQFVICYCRLGPRLRITTIVRLAATVAVVAV